MFRLTDDFDDVFEYEGKPLFVQLAFDNVLRMLDMLQDSLFTDAEKIEIALEILVNPYERIERKSIDEKFALFSFIMKEFLDIDLNAEEEPADAQEQEPQQEEQASRKVYDFVQDAGIIYASFFRAYNLDLFEQQGKLHWKKFLQFDFAFCFLLL